MASDPWERQLEEVRLLGEFNSPARTPEQTRIAYFWANDLDGTYKPPGQLFAHTQAVSRRRKLSVLDNVRLFGLVGLALADAAIAAWDSKYLTGIDLWRPETAIRQADRDGRPGTDPETGWVPLGIDTNGVNFSPAFPAYVSGHATFAAAWAEVMRLYFDSDSITFEAGTEDPHYDGEPLRSYPSFTAAAEENARSRIFLGVHYQWDADAGVDTGNSVGRHVFTNYLNV